MNRIFDQPEPDILLQYYDEGESFWQKVKRLTQNIFRCLRGEELLSYDERYDGFVGAEFLEEWFL